MITERQQEQASLYALGALAADDQHAFERELADDAELRQLVSRLRKTLDCLVLTLPRRELPSSLRERVLQGVQAHAPSAAATFPSTPSAASAEPGFRFVAADDATGWKPLPVPGASIKLLVRDHAHRYVVLLGKLEAGARYPAHTHHGSESLYLLTGDLHIGGRVMRPGDFHHAEPGTAHGENYSVEGCTLLAILSADHALAQLATGS